MQCSACFFFLVMYWNFGYRSLNGRHFQFIIFLERLLQIFKNSREKSLAHWPRGLYSSIEKKFLRARLLLFDPLDKDCYSLKSLIGS